MLPLCFRTRLGALACEGPWGQAPRRGAVWLAVAAAAAAARCPNRSPPPAYPCPPAAAVSALCIWGLLVVAGVIVFRSAQIVGGPGYDWGAVKAFNPSGLDFLSALVLIIFGFQVGVGGLRTAPRGLACNGAGEQSAGTLRVELACAAARAPPAVPHQRRVCF